MVYHVLILKLSELTTIKYSRVREIDDTEPER
jgi:hypothetical protein